MKGNMREFTAEFYINNLLKKGLKALKQEKKIGLQQMELSRLYAIFQGWKCWTKENILLKKYLDEADETFARDDVISDCSREESFYSSINQKSEKSDRNYKSQKSPSLQRNLF